MLAEGESVKFATKLRLLLLLSISLMLAPLFMLAGGAIGGPPLWEGDRVEHRVCPDCQGKGQGCLSCRGRGKADYILPGPHRPTQFDGLLLDPKGTWKGDPPPGPLPRQPQGRGVFPAHVKFITQDGYEVPFETDAQGRFQVELPPGTYRVQAGAPGYQSYDSSLKVEPLTQEFRYDAGRGAMYRLPLIIELTKT